MKVGNAYSSWREIFYGIPHGSITGTWSRVQSLVQLLCDSCYFWDGVSVASYTNNTTPYSVGKTISFFFSGNDVLSVNINNNAIISENKNELLGIGIGIGMLYFMLTKS